MTSFKLLASRAQNINQYKNLRTKVAKCCANIYFNKQCIKNKVVPKYAQIKIPNTSPTSLNTTQKVQILRIKEEIKFLHKKKEQLNRELYTRHLQAAQEWGKAWEIIQESIQESINREMEKKYKTMDEKLKKLIQSQSYKPSTSTQFYPRVVNKTNIHFSDDELGLLNKGLKYNLSKKHEHWISNLALEVETAVTLLPPGEQDYIRHQVAKNVKILYQQNASRTHNDIKAKKEDKILKQIKGKLLKKQSLRHQSRQRKFYSNTIPR